ncbi:MAG: ATP-binding protein [Burkholderiales bacterium]|nr:ATP-binding protein [Burkholderiales bacterium]
MLDLLGELFVPDPQSIRVAKEIIALTIGFSESNWRNPSRYQARLYEAFDDQPGLDETWWPVSLCGHAGVGKSSLLKHLAAIIQKESPPALEIAGFSEPVDNKVIIYTAFSPGSTPSSILHELGGIPKVQVKHAPKGQQLMAYVAQALSRANTCAAILDENQFGTLSTDAYAMVSRNLMLPIALRVASVATLNFSLYERLAKAPPQLGDRFLSFPLLITPPNLNSGEWGEYCAALKSVLSGQLEFDPFEQQAELWRLSLGIKRYMVKLLGIAAAEASEAGAKTITWSHVGEAYASQAFGKYRVTLETISKEAIAGAPERKSDTWCPFQRSDQASHEYYEGLRTASAPGRSQSKARGALTLVEDRNLKEALQHADKGSGDPQRNGKRSAKVSDLGDWQRAAKKLQGT